MPVSLLQCEPFRLEQDTMQLLFVLLTLFAVAHGKSYDGYQVFEITPKSRTQFQQMMDLDGQFFDDLDFLKTKPVGEPSQVMVPPMHVDKLKEALEELQIEFGVYIDNLQPLIDKETKAIASREKATTLASFDYKVYHSVQEISDWMTDFSQTESTSSLTIKEIYIGHSFEGRSIKALKISTGSGRLGAYTQGGIDAREWISPATVIYVVQKFVAGFKSGYSAATTFFNKFDWYVIPLLNPDGYHYTRPESSPNDRMWSKNRQLTSSTYCKGINLNRNYGYQWAGSGSSSNPCSEVYFGDYPYSSYEIKSVKNWLLNLKKSQTFMIHVDVHSYGQYWVYPYSYINSQYAKTEDHDDLERVAKAATQALTAVFGTKYKTMTSGDLYPAGGVSEDFGYKILKAKYSYAVKLRDTGHYGYELPENQIRPCGDETYSGFREMFLEVLKEV
ncbi:carboxypeptidase B-like [Acanthaster planci]|uniref:Carboxypeptidase B-like n=1 Tax=Acanthaster planci TaxID=133434 RepID=A0A8B7YI04_ACAPL|nr:carboxypeptidase B-like [Acanthaster planci]